MCAVCTVHGTEHIWDGERAGKVYVICMQVELGSRQHSRDNVTMFSGRCSSCRQQDIYLHSVRGHRESTTTKGAVAYSHSARCNVHNRSPPPALTKFTNLGHSIFTFSMCAAIDGHRPRRITYTMYNFSHMDCGSCCPAMHVMCVRVPRHARPRSLTPCRIYNCASAIYSC